ncbi:Sulfoacetaldehyde acetyltransferase [bacterium HR23]|nr:Sulfoacetaldehyde acetyltransferase [bacterium HR23]
MRLSAGQATVECLKAEGVKYIFGVVGSSFVEVLDAMYGREDIRYVGVRHEEGGAFMALGYAMATGQPGVCMVTNGPGVTNLVTGVAGAYKAHAPMVVLSGAPMLAHLFRDSFQEIDHLGVLRPVCKAVFQVNRPERIPELLRHAFRVATSGKMGPVLVDIPRDLFNATDLEVEVIPPERSRPAQRPEGESRRIQEAAVLLSRARFPVIVAGGGVKWSGAHRELARLADFLSAPVVASYGRPDVLPNDHPLYIGVLGRTPEAAEATQRADVVLALGTRLGHFTTFYDYRYIPRDAQIIQVEIDPVEIGRTFPVAVGIQGDAQAVAQALLSALERVGPPPEREARLTFSAQLREKRWRRLEAEGGMGTLPLKPQRVMYELRRALPPDASVVADAGAAPGYAQDRLFFSQPNTFFSSLDLGCVGSGFPMAIGVKMARPDRPVVALCGDGGFMMSVQELETAVRWKVPVVAVIMNNNSWGSEKAYQKYFYNERYVEADITNPRFDRLAELFGGKGFYVERPQEVGEAVHEALRAGVPSLIEIPIDPNELPFPARAADVFQGRQPTSR